MRKSGVAFHCHHDSLLEYVYDFDERVDYIKRYKPKGERELRLRLFKLIPNECLPGRGSGEWAAYDKARAACDKARAACDKARVAYDKARVARDKARAARDKARAACDKARVAYDKVWAAYGKVWVAYDKVWVAYTSKYRGNLEGLHSKLCPGCPWDGKTIFTGK